MRQKQKLLTPELMASFSAILGTDHVLQAEDLLQPYSHDETEDLRFLPEVVLKPRTAQEISQIMQLCNRHNIPVTARGAGTGLSGGALPVNGGVVLAMENHDRFPTATLVRIVRAVADSVMANPLHRGCVRYGRKPLRRHEPARRL